MIVVDSLEADNNNVQEFQQLCMLFTDIVCLVESPLQRICTATCALMGFAAGGGMWLPARGAVLERSGRGGGGASSGAQRDGAQRLRSTCRPGSCLGLRVVPEAGAVALAQKRENTLGK